MDLEAAPWSWHRELDGRLCLVADDDRDGLWWREAPAFLEHVAAWFTAADSGWPDDRPDLDLERYFLESLDTRLYLFPDLEPYENSYVRFRSGQNGTMGLASRMEKPLKPTKKFRLDRFGYVVHLGDLRVPPRCWSDVVRATNARIDLERAIRGNRLDLLALCYERAGQQGALVLEVGKSPEGNVEMRRLRSASTGPAPTLIRSGPIAPKLAEKRVAIVGLGAIGSYVADMVVRAGVRKLTLLDGDVMKPGNTVRHLLSAETVGLPKVDAVRNELVRRHGISGEDAGVRGALVLTDQSAYELLQNHDLVIDATAAFPVTALLHAAAEAEGLHVISVALQNEGETLRIDVLPPLSGESLPESNNFHRTSAAVNFEAGCGSPVSPTPPFAVVEAAAVAVRHAVGILVDRPLHPAGEVRNLDRGAE